MEESILLTIRRMMGPETSEYDVFDPELIIHINTAINELHQLGVKTCDNYIITGPDEMWDDIVEDNNNLSLIKTYIFLYVKTLFDPPTTGIVSDAMKRTLDRLEWRINVEVDPGGENNA